MNDLQEKLEPLLKELVADVWGLARADIDAYGKDIAADFARYLFNITNVGVAFDDTDEISTRTVGSVADPVRTINEAFPDGHIRDDFARFLYQFQQVIEAPTTEGRLILGPAPKRYSFHPRSKPPVSRVGGKEPEVV